jgi:hypothetical protein
MTADSAESNIASAMSINAKLGAKTHRDRPPPSDLQIWLISCVKCAKTPLLEVFSMAKLSCEVGKRKRPVTLLL